MYGSWDIRHDGQSFLLFWAIFLPVDPPNNTKNQNFENEKNPRDIIILILVYRKWQSYNVWFLKYWAWQTKFHPTNKPENKILKNWRKKTPGDIILHKCAKNHDHILYCSWDMARDGCNFYFSFWPTFCPFIPVTARKIKIKKKKWKNAWGYHHCTNV